MGRCAGTAVDEMRAVTILMRVQQLVLAELDELLRPHGLTFARYEALGAADVLPGRVAAAGQDGRAAAGAPDLGHVDRRPAGGVPVTSYAVGTRPTAAPCSPRSPRRAAPSSRRATADLVARRVRRSATSRPRTSVRALSRAAAPGPRGRGRLRRGLLDRASSTDLVGRPTISGDVHDPRRLQMATRPQRPRASAGSERYARRGCATPTSRRCRASRSSRSTATERQVRVARVSSRSPAGSTPPAIAGAPGRSGSSPASATPSRPTSATR